MILLLDVAVLLRKCKLLCDKYAEKGKIRTRNIKRSQGAILIHYVCIQ